MVTSLIKYFNLSPPKSCFQCRRERTWEEGWSGWGERRGEGGGGEEEGGCTESIPCFHVFHNTHLHFEFLPSSSSLFILCNFFSSVFLSFVVSFLFLRFAFPFLVWSYKGLQKFIDPICCNSSMVLPMFFRLVLANISIFSARHQLDTYWTLAPQKARGMAGFC